jgi:NAD(P)-dependent dehydrogenase (short-subunit alcohol dehydrogenase family)
MERALIIGETGGIGAALAVALRTRGVQVDGLSRRDGFDLCNEASIESGLRQIETGLDLVVIATGALELVAPPEKSLRSLDAAVLAKQFAVNAIGPALVMKHALGLLPRDRVSRLAVLSARVGSIDDNRTGGWYGYRAAKAALNQYLRCAAIEARRSHPYSIFVALHPGTVATPLTRKFVGTHPAVTPQEASANLLRVLDGLLPKNSGGFFDWKGDEIPW